MKLTNDKITPATARTILDTKNRLTEAAESSFRRGVNSRITGIAAARILKALGWTVEVETHTEHGGRMCMGGLVYVNGATEKNYQSVYATKGEKTISACERISSDYDFRIALREWTPPADLGMKWGSNGWKGELCAWGEAIECYTVRKVDGKWTLSIKDDLWGTYRTQSQAKRAAEKMNFEKHFGEGC